MTATEMKPRMTAGLFCVCSMALQPSLYVAGWNPLLGLVMPVASGWQQPAAHRRVAQTALTRVGGPEIRAVRMSTPCPVLNFDQNIKPSFTLSVLLR